MNSKDATRKSEILSAAFSEFSSKGFKGATIKSIAETANLQSPSLIYWYFPTKKILFAAVLKEYSPLLQALSDFTDGADLSPTEVLTKFIQRYLSTFKDDDKQRMFRLLLMEAIQQSNLADILGRQGIDKTLEIIKEYLTYQIQIGQMIDHDVRVSSQLIIGFVLPQVLRSTIFPNNFSDDLSQEQYIKEGIDLILHGLVI